MFYAVGCASQKHFEDPVAVMRESKDPIDRMAAARQAQVTHVDDPARIAALNNMLWSRGYGSDERCYAIDQLLAHDEHGFREVLARRITRITNRETLAYVCELVIEHQWIEFTPAMVRSNTRPLPFTDNKPRPEVLALESLHPGIPLNEIVFKVFVDADNTASIEEQAAAWSLIWKLADYDQIQALLQTASPANPMVIDLKAAMTDLHCLPQLPEGYLRLAWLRSPERSAYWDKAKAIVAKLDATQIKGLELRHLPILLALDEASRSLSREQLIEAITSQLDNQKHYLRGPTFDGPMSEYPQRFAQAIDQLAWADLATIHLLYVTVQKPQVIEALFKQGDADHVDIGSEHGGVLTIEDDQVNATRFAAMIRQQDYKFIPSDQMIQSLYTNLAHYHFHAQHYKNRDYAGPSMGDLRMAKKLETHALVFTFINQDEINVDYYQPNGAVADLGVIRR